jgi:hypothetical protein
MSQKINHNFCERHKYAVNIRVLRKFSLRGRNETPPEFVTTKVLLLYGAADLCCGAAFSVSPQTPF